MAFSKLRAYPGKVAARDVDELIVEIGKGLALITSGNAKITSGPTDIATMRFDPKPPR